MKKPKKGYQDGGSIQGENPKFKSQKEFNDFYKSQGYSQYPNSPGVWYDPKKFNIAPASEAGKAQGRTYEYKSLDPSIQLDAFGVIPSQHLYTYTAPSTPIKEQPAAKPMAEQTNMVQGSFGQMGPGTFARTENGQTVWYNQKGPLPVLGKKNGGMVGKYADGGWVDKNGNPVNDPNISKYSPEEIAALGYTQAPNQNSVGQQFMQGAKGFMRQGGYGTAGNILGSLAQNQLDSQHKGPSVGGGIAGGALKGAGLGMEIGGPLGAAAGAVGGGLLGYLQGKSAVSKNKQMGELDATQQALANQNNPAMANKSFKSAAYNPNDYKSTFGIQGFAKGGKVEGPGGPKDDAIKAKVEADSFVVPAENSKVAEYLRSKYLTKGNQKANLKQKDGEGVYLSNGEHLFTPEETEELLKNGVDVNMLAPNSDDNMYAPQNWHFKKGGLTPGKAKEILNDKSVHGHPLTDKQRRYMGWVAGGKKAEGGLVEALKEGGTVKMSKKEFVAEHQELVDILKRGTKKELMKEAKEQGEELKDVRGYKDGGGIGDDPAEAYRKTGKKEDPFDMYYKGRKSPSKSVDLPSMTGAQIAALYNKKAPVKPASGLLDTLRFDPSKYLDRTSGDENMIVPEAKTTLVPATPTSPAVVSTTQGTPDSATSTPKQPFSASQRDFGGILGGLQAAIGTGYLMGQGKRPVYSIGPELQGQTQRAIAQSQYGYTPEQKALLQNQAVENRNTELANVYSMAGGNAGVALNNARAVFNDAYTNRLKTESDDEMLKASKMGQANQMASQNEAYRRQAFQDRLSAFMQNQSAGAQLLGTGIDNVISSQRYAQAKQANDEINKLMYGA